MTPTSSVDDDLVGMVNRREAAAAEALFQAYTPYLRAIVRRNLSDRLRGQFDSSDVVQSVWVQVVKQLGRDGWRVPDEDRLRGLLATIARRRLISKVRRLGASADDARPDAEQWEAVQADNQPRPSEEAQATDLWGQMLEVCPPEHRPVLALRRQGLSSEEIAARTGLHEGSVRRILRQVARRLAMASGDVEGERGA